MPALATAVDTAWHFAGLRVCSIDSFQPGGRDRIPASGPAGGGGGGGGMGATFSSAGYCTFGVLHYAVWLCFGQVT